MLIKALLSVLLVVSCSHAFAQHGKDLIEMLKGGGFTIFFRHSITDGADPKKSNPPNETLRDCNTQRPLNEQGREQALLIGEKFKEHGIPVGDVYASLVCRCEETAKLAFGKATAVEWMVLGRGVSTQPELQKQMLTIPSTGFFTKVPTDKNNIYVGHAQTLTQRMIGPLFPRIFLSEGEGIVFDPSNKQFIGRISPSSW
jgi:hypothetical protein